MTTNTTLTTTIRLTAVEPDDVNFLMQWENDPDLWIYSDTIAPLSRHILTQYAENYDADPFRSGQLRLMIRIGSHTIGIADLYNIEPIHSRAMAGIFIAPQYRHKGYALHAITQLTNYSHTTLGLQNLFALIEPSNHPSIGLFKSAGYEIAATLPQWRRTPAGFTDIILFRHTR